MRAIFKFSKESSVSDSDFINVPADSIDIRDGWIGAWNGEKLVAIAKADLIDSCHLSEKKEER